MSPLYYTVEGPMFAQSDPRGCRLRFNLGPLSAGFTRCAVEDLGDATPPSLGIGYLAYKGVLPGLTSQSTTARTMAVGTRS
jgi:hypothetical protein